MVKRGQYFTVDAFAAMLVIASGLILVFALNTYKPSTAQPELLSQEFVNVLMQTKIREINSPFIFAQTRANNITNTDNTILQQSYEFWKYGNPNFATEMLSNVTQNLVPKQYKFQILMDGEAIYTKGEGQNETQLLVSSKRVLFGTIIPTMEFWGPVVAEVRVWQ